MKQVFDKPKSLYDARTHYCPGCGHGTIHRLIAEVIDELAIRGKVIAVAPVGCAVIAYDYWDFDTTEAAHGRPPAVATGIKRMKPESVVFTYQGDGDLAAIGTAEIIHAANRGENFSVFFVNNGTYGMTGGQMAPTTLAAQKTTTTPRGRNVKTAGYPLKISEMLAILPGVCYLERTSTHSPQAIFKTKAAIKKSFMKQIEKKGFSMVEILSSCPTYWKLSAADANRRIEKEIAPYYPLGVLVER
ncbi:MAG: thiamine pyrophosphate-dependent enzyme [Candidatus Omnitrophota bacterium]